jgi:hypothetical protein
MKVKIKGIVHEVDYGHGPKYYMIFSTDCSDKYYAAIGPAEFEYEVPEGFDPRPAKVAAIDAAITQARADFTRLLNELQEQKNKLLCLELA